MVQFPGCAFRTLCIQARMTGIWPVGLPHSAIRGSRDVCSSPRLIAAYHGLLRTAAPRHPPWTLFRLTILSFALQPRLHAAHRRFRPAEASSRVLCRKPSSAPLKLSSLRAPRPLSHAPRASLLARHPVSRATVGARSSSPFPCVVKDHVRWRYGDLNPRPMACKATALATELYPQVSVSRLATASTLRVEFQVDDAEYEEREGQERTGLRHGFRRVARLSERR